MYVYMFEISVIQDVVTALSKLLRYELDCNEILE